MIRLKKGSYEAADPCEQCGGRIRVDILFVSKHENFGDILWECEGCGLSDADVAGWEYADSNVEIVGRKYLPFKSVANYAPCHGCGKLVIGVPLILFIGKPSPWGEIHFCWTCAEQLEILEKMLGKL